MNRLLWMGPLRGIGCGMVLLACQLAAADEGMWLFSHPPRQVLKEKYGFEPTSAWLEHLQKAAVRFGGASGEFVSEDGLILSNQHVGSRAIHRLSTSEHNYTRDGFYARTQAEEKPCPGLELNVLMEIEDVTARVNTAVAPGMTDDAAFKARRAVIAEIERESLEKSGLRSDVITLYQGAEYHLYRYKKYTDVRLVFAPEEQIAFFGGDADNFEYPRFDLDISFFRAYENGRPAKVKHYLKWSQSGPVEDELVFVPGHPGRTDRLRTVAELEYLRDSEYPRGLERLKRLEVLLGAFSGRSQENERRARADLRGVENSRKVRDGALAGLMDPKLMHQKRAAEEQLRSAVAATPDLAGARGSWDRIAQAQKVIGQHAVKYDFLERGYGFNSSLFSFARQLLRASEERPKPNGERLEEYRTSALPSLEVQLFAEQPIYQDLETLKMSDSLTYLCESLGYTNPLVQKVLCGKSPRERAAELVLASKLASPALRRELYEGGQAALEKNPDLMIELARMVDGEARSVRGIIEAQHEAIRQAHALIGKARYALKGHDLYPDATSSLRLAFGTTKAYVESGRPVPFQTTFAGLYQRAEEQDFKTPFDLPKSWLAGRKELNLATPFNFVCTADIIGGNSGSPVVNRNGEFVGIIFDGNIQSLVTGFIYTEEQARAVSVHSSAILEALRKIYNAAPLVDELLGSRAADAGVLRN